MKLHLHVSHDDSRKLVALTNTYRDACNAVSQYIFDHGFVLNSVSLSNILYYNLRTAFGLKSQMVQKGVIHKDSGIAVDSTHILANTVKKVPERMMAMLAKRI